MIDRENSTRQSQIAGTSAASVAWVCGAEILGLAGYSIVPALLPQFIETWSLSSAQGGWFAGIMFAGYMLSVVPLVSLTDVVPARTVYLVSSALGAMSCFGVALSDDFGSALSFRALAGIALAGMYMPGLRALSDRIEGPRRARVAAFYTSSFTVGASLSFLLGQASALWGWRSVFIAAGVLALAGMLMAWAALPRSSIVGVPFKQRPQFPIGAVIRNRDVLVLIFAYAAVIWGSAGLRQWIVVFLGFCAGDTSYVATHDWSVLATAALIGLLGVPAGLLGNELAIRFGLRVTAMLVFLMSALATTLFGLVGLMPFIAVVLLSLITGFIVQGNFSNLTSGLLVVADPRYTGATMALYSCIGFGGGFLGTLMFGITLDEFGGITQLTAWVLSFGTCGLACLAGAAATALLSRNISRY
jgi:predicted MFS family arabinose efflux permease